MISRWGCNTNNLVRFTLCQTQMQLLKPHCIDNLGCPFIIEVKAVSEEIEALIQNQKILCLKFCFCTMCVVVCVLTHPSVHRAQCVRGGERASYSGVDSLFPQCGI